MVKGVMETEGRGGRVMEGKALGGVNSRCLLKCLRERWVGEEYAPKEEEKRRVWRCGFWGLGKERRGEGRGEGCRDKETVAMVDGYSLQAVL